MLSQDIPPSNPVDQDEETWDTVGAMAEKNVSLPPTTREVVQGSAQQGSGADNSQVSAGERRQNPSPTAVMEQPEETQVEDEATTEAAIVDIASILGARAPDRDCCPFDLVSFF
jgi:hypothetical protein